MKVPVKKTTTKNANSAQSVDLEERIRRRAFELYERRGRGDGRDIEDWLQAEAELARERTEPLARAAVKRTRKAPVASTGIARVKQVKTARTSTQSKTEEEARNGH